MSFPVSFHWLEGIVHRKEIVCFEIIKILEF